MSDQVKDAILENRSEDPYLAGLVELTIDAILTGRPLFDNPLIEPSFYRLHFKQWVKEGIEEAQAIAADQAKNNIPE
jgi:hypothetical protein